MLLKKLYKTATATCNRLNFDRSPQPPAINGDEDINLMHNDKTHRFLSQHIKIKYSAILFS